MWAIGRRSPKALASFLSFLVLEPEISFSLLGLAAVDDAVLEEGSLS
jgi:hypothetical protein